MSVWQPFLGLTECCRTAVTSKQLQEGFGVHCFGIGSPRSAQIHSIASRMAVASRCLTHSVPHLECARLQSSLAPCLLPLLIHMQVA